MNDPVEVRAYDQLIRHIVVPTFTEIVYVMAFTGMNFVGESDYFTTDLAPVTI